MNHPNMVGGAKKFGVWNGTKTSKKVERYHNHTNCPIELIFCFQHINMFSKAVTEFDFGLLHLGWI